MDLKFDKMTVDTTLAQEYLNNEKLSDKFSEFIYFDGKEFSEDKAPVKISRTDISLYMKNLAARLKENIDLFAQLDYLARNVPIKDTHDQIHLIIQQLYYMVSCNTEVVLKVTNCDKKRTIVTTLTKLQKTAFPQTSKATNYSIRMLSDTPLLRLGIVGKLISYYEFTSVIWSSEKTLAICHLFTKLCYESGITGIQMRYSEYIDNDELNYKYCKEEHGSVGVISEYSDIDSAVDVFLASSKQVPWSLRRILVQESVYAQFNNALSWKCKSSKQNEEKTIGISTPVEHEGRKFLIDSVGNVNPKPTEVAVESYRTIKELISLLNQYRLHYLSLWANNTAEINEITHSIPSQVVWVNSFADFRGPPRITEAFFSYLPFFYFSTQFMLKKEISELQQAWVKLDIQNRYNILVSAVNKVAADQSDHCIYREMKDILRKIDIYSFSFVNTGKDYVCIGVPAPADRTYLCDECSTLIVTEEFYESVLIGNAFVFRNCNPVVSVLIDSLKKAGAPVLAEPLDVKYSPGDYSVSQSYDIGDKLFYRYQGTRVIWTNSGTIFAN